MSIFMDERLINEISLQNTSIVSSGVSPREKTGPRELTMGASGSKNAVAPILPATALSASQVSEAVKSLGTPYIPYAEQLE